MPDDDEILEAVDQIADEIEDQIESNARRLGIGAHELIDRLANELKARLGGPLE